MFTLLKTAYCEQVKRLERGGVNTISKEHFTCLYSLIKEKPCTLKNIKASFTVSSLYLLNPDQVLRDMPKPPIELTILKVYKVRVVSYKQDIIL
jgi:hypothetical protein